MPPKKGPGQRMAERRKRRKASNITTVTMCLGGYDCPSMRKWSRKCSKRRLGPFDRPDTRLTYRGRRPWFPRALKRWAGFARLPCVQQALLRASQFMTALWTEALLLADVHLRRILDQGQSARAPPLHHQLRHPPQSAIDALRRSGFGENCFWGPIFHAASHLLCREESKLPGPDTDLGASVALYKGTRQHPPGYVGPGYERWMYHLIEEARQVATTSFRSKWSEGIYKQYYRRYLGTLLRKKAPAFAEGAHFASALTAFSAVVIDGDDVDGVATRYTSITDLITAEDKAWMCNQRDHLQSLNPAPPELPFKRPAIGNDPPSDGDDRRLDAIKFLHAHILPALLVAEEERRAEDARLRAQKLADEEEARKNPCGCLLANHKLLRKGKRGRGGRRGQRGKLAFSLSIIPSFKPKFIRLTNTSFTKLVTTLALAPTDPRSVSYPDPLSGEPHPHETFEQLINASPETMWKACFRFSRRCFRHKNIDFNDMSLVTDGCSVSVKMTHWKSREELEEDKLEEGVKVAKRERAEKIRTAKKKGETLPPLVRTDEEEEKERRHEEKLEERFEIARRQKEDPVAFPPTALDPGKASIYCGLRITSESDLNTYDLEDEERTVEVIECSGKKRSRMAGHVQRQKLIEKQMDEWPGLKDFNANMPTARGATLQAALQRSRHIHEHKDVVDGFYGNRMFLRRLRFGTRLREQQAMEAHIAHVTGTKNHEEQKSRIVIMGDADINAGGWGKPTMNKGLKQVLDQRCVFFPINEFRSSKCCAKCYSPMKGKKETFPCGISNVSYSMRHCSNSDCRVKDVHRDINAPVNIYHFWCWIRDEIPFPPIFQRGTEAPPVEDAEEDDGGGEVEVDEQLNDFLNLTF